MRMLRTGSRRSRTASAFELTRRARAGHTHVTASHRWLGIHVRRTAVTTCRGLAEFIGAFRHLRRSLGIRRTRPMRTPLHGFARRARQRATVTATCRLKPVGRHEGGNSMATRHPAPAARRVEAKLPDSAWTRHAPARTANSHNCRGVPEATGSAVRIRASALTPSPGVNLSFAGHTGQRGGNTPPCTNRNNVRGRNGRNQAVSAVQRHGPQPVTNAAASSQRQGPRIASARRFSPTTCTYGAFEPTAPPQSPPDGTGGNRSVNTRGSKAPAPVATAGAAAGKRTTAGCSRADERPAGSYRPSRAGRARRALRSRPYAQRIGPSSR